MRLQLLLCTALITSLTFALVGCGDDEPENQNATPEAVFAVGVDLTSTADAKQEQTILSLAASQLAEDASAITIDYPLDESIFPPEIVAPTFLWHETSPQADRWLIDVSLNSGEAHIYVLAEGPPPAVEPDDPECYGTGAEPYALTEYQASAKSWTPSEDVWTVIKEQSVDNEATVTIVGFDSRNPNQPLSHGRMALTTSSDYVGAPIFYRDVPLMPVPASEEGGIMPTPPDILPLITWRLKDISRNDNRAVLAGLPTCANCHSFSDDGRTMGMDIDRPFGDKGAYALLPINETITINIEDVFTWNSFPGRPEDHRTIGFLSQVSPDGQHVISTVNEDIYINNYTDFRFLQVFYPTRGILAHYSRETGEIKALPGADDPEFVHCEPVWTPDGETIIFARARACDAVSEVQPTYANDPAELQIQYDLYRIPFPNDEGEQPVPIEGASENGMSNTFPKVSPDGKWLVFVKCKTGQLMRPDGELWIVPVEGGEARRMACNTSLMNSWHSFSPDGRWMVFSSKVNRPYTQMFLTHLDEDGNSSPPILITNTTASNRAINIPEFVKIKYDDLQAIEIPAVDHYHYLTRARNLMDNQEYEEALVMLQKTLESVPTSVHVNSRLGTCLVKLGRLDEATEAYKTALETDPRNVLAHTNLGMVLGRLGRLEEALVHLDQAVEIEPGYGLAYVNRAVAHSLMKQYDSAWADVHQAEQLGVSAHPRFLKDLQQASGRQE